MNSRQVTIQRHGRQDVRADDLTVGVKGGDDRAHDSAKVPRTVT